MSQPDSETARNLYRRYRRERDGIRNCPEMASICLICGSLHVVPGEKEPGTMVCRDCGFAFYRYLCPVCGASVDGRDPMNPGCGECGLRVCGCGACGCDPGYEGTIRS